MQVAKVKNDVAERLLYIAKLNPRGVNKLAYQYGYEAPRNDVKSRFNFLVNFYQENCDEDKGIDDLLTHHPDFIMFAETFGNHLKKRNEEFEVPYDQYPMTYLTFNGGGDDSFVGAIADAVGAGASAAGQFAGTGKKGRESKQKLSEEETRRTQLAGQTMLMQSVAQQKLLAQRASDRNKTILIVVAVVVVLGLVGGSLWYAFKK